MKTPRSLALAFLITASFASAAEASAADRDWVRSVEKLFARRRTSVTTPLEHRAKLAAQVAERLGHRCAIRRTENGFKVVLQS